jgi:cytochrome c oxidase cbb3-type subunit III
MSNKPNEEDRLLDHSYDGIQEYDNPMPRWWVWGFYATVIFVPIYYFLPAPFGEGPGNVAAYEAEVAAYKATQPEETGPGVSDEQLLALVSDASQLASGKVVYDANCSACHRPDGGGLIGPNLTDDAWIHGGSPSQIHLTIAQGVLAKGMPAWDRLLKPEQVNAVTAYVISLKGTNPKDAKAPEGTVPVAAEGTTGT